MTHPDENRVNTAAVNPEHETEAAGGEDIYGADGDAGTARAQDQVADDTTASGADDEGAVDQEATGAAS